MEDGDEAMHSVKGWYSAVSCNEQGQFTVEVSVTCQVWLAQQLS